MQPHAPQAAEADVIANYILSCVCGLAVDPRAPGFLIECHYCGRWLHGACAQISEQDALRVVKFACSTCRARPDQTTLECSPNERRDPIALDNLGFAPLPVHCSAVVPTAAATSYRKDSASFRRLLRAAIFAKSGVQSLQTATLSSSYLRELPAFHEPLLLSGSDRNTTTAPDEKHVAALLAATTNANIHVCDVASQHWEVVDSTSTWEKKLADDKTAKLANAHFRLQEAPSTLRLDVRAPAVVTQADWQHLVPTAASSPSSPPELGNTNVLGGFLGAHAFLDFVQAPAGQCTWLSVAQGELWAFLVPPSSTNLQIYHDWRANDDAATINLAERVEKCIRCVVPAGSSLVLPAGWLLAQFAGGENPCALFQGFFACTAALDAQLRALEPSEAPELSQSSIPGWLAVDANVQLWSAVCFYTRHLLSTSSDNSVHINEQERRALQRALPRLRRWSASPASLKSADGISWTPSSPREAQGIIQRLQQALGPPSPELQPTSVGLDDHGKLGSGSLPTISPTEASYIYSAASGDAVSSSTGPWVSTAMSTSSDSNLASTAPMASVWANYDPMNSPSGLVISTQGPPFFSSSQGLQENLQGYNTSTGASSTSFDYQVMGSGSNYMAAPAGLEGLNALAGLHSTAGMTVGSMGSSGSASMTATTSTSGYPRHGRLDSTGNYVDGLMRHRASCHRCGNLRKKNVRCPVCPHIFCAKCAEKMLDEHGEGIFVAGCPVCKELCCCGKNRTTRCQRKFHCYKKCPATKRPAGAG